MTSRVSCANASCVLLIVSWSIKFGGLWTSAISAVGGMHDRVGGLWTSAMSAVGAWRQYLKARVSWIVQGAVFTFSRRRKLWRSGINRIGWAFFESIFLRCLYTDDGKNQSRAGLLFSSRLGQKFGFVNFHEHYQTLATQKTNWTTLAQGIRYEPSLVANMEGRTFGNSWGSKVTRLKATESKIYCFNSYWFC